MEGWTGVRMKGWKDGRVGGAIDERLEMWRVTG